MLARRSGALRSWIAQYHGVEATATLGDDRVWTVDFNDRDGRQVAEVRINDYTDEAVRASAPARRWLAAGPRRASARTAAWPTAAWMFLPLCALFLAGLMDWRRPLSMRTLDLLALLSFGVSLHWFNQGEHVLARRR